MRRFHLALAAAAVVALAANAQPGGPKGPPGGFPKLGGPGVGTLPKGGGPGIGTLPKNGPGPGVGTLPKGGPGPGGLGGPKGGVVIIPKLGGPGVAFIPKLGGPLGPRIGGPYILGPVNGPIPVLPPVVVNPVSPTGGSDIEPAAAQEWGMKITQLAADGAAAKANLQVGHVIVYAAETRVQSFEELTGVLAQATGPIEIVVYLADTKSLAKTTITPVNGKIGVATDPVVIE
jgi:hypothetical protein